MSMAPANEPPPNGNRRYWGYWDRPYTGCGCFWLFLIVLFIWWLLALAWQPARFGAGWGWPGGQVVPPAGAPVQPGPGPAVR